MRLRDLTGKRFGKLLVLKRAGSDSTGKATWLCKCDCGNTSTPTGDKLERKRTVSCGCFHGRFKSKDISGQKFGRLIAVSKGNKDKSGRFFWNCKCDCGNYTIVRIDSLLSGQTRSCGCGFRGKSSFSWNKDLKEEQRITDRRYILGVVAWRKAIYLKDGFACQCCGDRTGGNLNAHHLESWDDNPELRFKLDNGVTLCDDCHREFHMRYGFGHNTQSQFIEFLEKFNS